MCEGITSKTLKKGLMLDLADFSWRKHTQQEQGRRNLWQQSNEEEKEKNQGPEIQKTTKQLEDT